MMTVDLFAGVGGWEEALDLLDYPWRTIGIENSPAACAVAEAAGHPRLLADITEVDPHAVTDQEVIGLLGAPPCQTFSAAGQGVGRLGIEYLATALGLLGEGCSIGYAMERAGLDGTDPRTSLTLQPMRFITAYDPQWIAFEEVKEVLPVWEVYAEILRARGYHVWTGVLNAADFGLPQARKRAFLLARKWRALYRPIPTHSRSGDWGLFDTREPWVPMAEPLGWGPEECREANRLAPQEAWDSEACLWPLSRPATTVVRSFRPDVIAAPGYRQKGDPSRQNAPGSVVVSLDELKVLMGVRPDFPIEVAPEGKRRSLLGGILPPSWAFHILSHLLHS